MAKKAVQKSLKNDDITQAKQTASKKLDQKVSKPVAKPEIQEPKNLKPAQSSVRKIIAKPNNKKLGNEFLRRLFGLRKKLFEEHKSLLNMAKKNLPQLESLMKELGLVETDAKDFKKYLKAYRDILPESPQNTQEMITELEEKISQLETRLNDLLEKTIEVQNEILLRPPEPVTQSSANDVPAENSPQAM